MGWSARERLNAGATAFDVRLRVYAGPRYRDLDLSAFTLDALPPGWASADAPTAEWREISDRVRYAGSLTYERTGATVRWRAELSGEDFDAALLGQGRAVLVLRTLEAGGVATGPGLWFVGQIVAGGSADDCRHGGEWTRSVRGTDALLERANARRVTAGPVDLAEGASAGASSTLATPEAEAGRGEFVGSTANVDANNAVDGNLNTVWISADAPTTTGETPVGTGSLIDKVFIKPLTGYDQAKLWWLEIRNGHPSQDMLMNGVYGPGQSTVPWAVVDQAGNELVWPASYREVLRPGERGIICSSRADFEAYTGGARDAAWVVEAKTWPLPPGATGRFALHPTAGWVKLQQWTVAGSYELADTVAWNATGAAVTGVAGWSGAGLNSAALPEGYCWRRKPSGADSNTVGDWFADPNYEPGDFAQPGQTEWLLVTPRGQDAALAEAVSAGASALELTSVLGFGDAGAGVCEGDAFSWTGRDGTTLTGVSGIGSHAQGARVYPTDGGIAQTGWPVQRIEVRRRAGLSVIARMRVYLQKTGETAPRTPGTDGWETDWDAHYLSYVWPPKPKDDSTEDVIVFRLDGPEGPGFRWVRRVMLFIEEMSDGGRAKVNDVSLLLAQATMGAGGQLDGGRSAELARHLLVAEYGLPAGAFVDLTPAGHGALGNHATAIAPYAAVLEDLARVTGCVVWYRPDGKVAWTADPWHPTGASDALLEPFATLEGDHARGQLRCGDQLPAESAVVVRAHSPDGAEQFEATYPINADESSLKREFTGLVCASAFEAWALAESLYCRNGLFLDEALAGPGTVALTLTGVGEWLRPDVWLRLALRLGEQQLRGVGEAGVSLPGYLVERVGFEWGRNDRGARSWKASVELRRFRR